MKAPGTNLNCSPARSTSKTCGQEHVLWQGQDVSEWTAPMAAIIQRCYRDQIDSFQRHISLQSCLAKWHLHLLLYADKSHTHTCQGLMHSPPAWSTMVRFEQLEELTVPAGEFVTLSRWAILEGTSSVCAQPPSGTRSLKPKGPCAPEATQCNQHVDDCPQRTTDRADLCLSSCLVLVLHACLSFLSHHLRRSE